MTDTTLDTSADTPPDDSAEETRAIHRLGVAGIVGMFSLAALFLTIGCVLPD